MKKTLIATIILLATSASAQDCVSLKAMEYQQEINKGFQRNNESLLKIIGYQHEMINILEDKTRKLDARITALEVEKMKREVNTR